mmetsp:Transcript_15523/g.48580  ORF Transcript_15523/g.48580 Transcript_15523/m.48580 type:complete len:342 (+) Transcript_15523:2539-3564(+)
MPRRASRFSDRPGGGQEVVHGGADDDVSRPTLTSRFIRPPFSASPASSSLYGTSRPSRPASPPARPPRPRSRSRSRSPLPLPLPPPPPPGPSIAAAPARNAAKTFLPRSRSHSVRLARRLDEMGQPVLSDSSCASKLSERESGLSGGGVGVGVGGDTSSPAAASAPPDGAGRDVGSCARSAAATRSRSRSRSFSPCRISTTITWSDVIIASSSVSYGSSRYSQCGAQLSASRSPAPPTPPPSPAASPELLSRSRSLATRRPLARTPGRALSGFHSRMRVTRTPSVVAATLRSASTVADRLETTGIAHRSVFAPVSGTRRRTRGYSSRRMVSPAGPAVMVDR